MPYVHVANAGPLDPDQRRKIAAGVTELLHEVTGKPHSSVYCRIDSVPRDEFAVGGTLLADRDAGS